MINFTYLIIAVTVVTTIIGFQNRVLFEKNTFSVGSILVHKEYFRLLTANFFHVDIAHLLFNMFSFFSFARHIESAFGWELLAVIYFFSALTGDLLALFIKRKDMSYRAVGASGAVCGVIFASVFLLPGGSIYIFPIPIAMPAWLYSILFILISIYGIGRGGSMIGHEAHLGGAMAGIISAVVYIPQILYTNYILLIVLIIPVIVLLVLSIKKPGIFYN